MTTNRLQFLLRVLLAAVCAFFTSFDRGVSSAALAQSVATTATRQMGTVKSLSGVGLTIATDAGQQFAVTVSDGARIVQLPPGSTDLKAAQAIGLSDIAVGDRVLVTGKAGDTADTFNASRVILMKSGDIAEKHAAEQADWQRRGMGGIVVSVDAATGAVNFSSGAKKTQALTTSKTAFRRYASDSVKFEDAKQGTIAQIQPGDQAEVRGTKSADGLSITAEEVVSGSFRNLSGTLASTNPTAGTITLKDQATKKTMTVNVTTNSDLRKLPPEVAARFAARQRGGTAGTSGAGTSAAGAPAATSSSVPSVRQASSGQANNPSGEQGGGRSAGMDLSKLLARLPKGTLGDLHTGDAVMIVASQSQPGSDMATAVTLLSGVEPILAATSTGAPVMTLSPWNVGGGAPEGGAGGPQ